MSSNNNISKLIQFEHNLRSCDNSNELYYSIVNETRDLVDFDQAVLFTIDLSSKLKVVSVSDIVSVDSTSPFVQYMQDLGKHILSNHSEDTLKVIDFKKDLTSELQKQLKDYSPSNIVFIPLKTIKNNVEVEYYLLLTKNQNFQKQDIELLNYVSQSIKYSLFAMNKDSFIIKLKNKKFKSKYFYLFLLALIVIMFLPVRMSVTAPFSVQAKKPYIVTSPIEGVVKEIKISPNENVKENQLLVLLEDIDLQNDYEITKRKLNTVKAELYSAKQASFYDMDKKSQVKRLQEEVKLKEAELKYSKSLLEKTKIFSSSSGIAIINNPNEWKGKPVVTGERILSIANPQKIEAKIMLSVKDALFLKDHAEVKLFLDNRVFETWQANVIHISYTPEVTPENIVSYKIIADFDDLNQNSEFPRIGLRGTAKIYSEKVTLFFYLFRKPITSLRQMLAW